MKVFILGLIFLGLPYLSFSQDDKPMQVEELPEIVIKRAGEDFSIYLPSKSPDKRVNKVQEKFIGYNLEDDKEGYKSYLVIMKIKEGSLVAKYNETGKLLSVVENYKNVKMPPEVIYSVFKKFPDWTIVKDKYLYSQEDGDIKENQYHVKIHRAKEYKELIVRPNGEIVSIKDK